MGTRLLSGMCCGADEAVLSVLAIDSCGNETRFEGTRLLDLAMRLWPQEEERPENFCRALRFITDVSKRDFLLRPWRSNFLVRADFCRAIVEQDRVLFLEPKTATFEEFRPEFVCALRARADMSDERLERSFDLWALECIVCANVTMHTMRLQVMRPVITNIVSSMDLHGSERSILRLYPLKVSLSKFIEQVKPLVACLKDLLEAESQNNIEEQQREKPRCCSSDGRPDLVRISEQDAEVQHDPSCPNSSAVGGVTSGASHARCRTGTVDSNSDAGSAGTSRTDDWRRASSALEDVLETWAFNAQEVLADAVELNANIEDATRFMEASMSYSRTSLLRLELIAMVVGLAFAFGALVSGIFGMNLKTPLFDEPPETGYFNMAVGGIGTAGFLIVFVSWMLFQRGKRHYRKYCERFGRNEFFRRIEDDEYVLQLSTLQGPDGTMSPAAFDRVLRDLKTPAPPLQPYQALRPCGAAAGVPPTDSGRRHGSSQATLQSGATREAQAASSSWGPPHASSVPTSAKTSWSLPRVSVSPRSGSPGTNARTQASGFGQSSRPLPRPQPSKASSPLLSHRQPQPA